MFGVDSGELFLIVLVAVVVIGPKDLPRVMRTIGHWVGKARGMANQFRSGVDQMMRESEIADLEKKWREQNDAIMMKNPFAPDAPVATPEQATGDPAPAWSLAKDSDETVAQQPVAAPAARAAPMPPIGAAPTRPTPPKLDKARPAPSEPASVRAAPAAFPLAPDPSPGALSKRRAPRVAPDRP